MVWLQDTSQDVTTQRGPNGERLQNNGAAVDYDALAQAAGYPDFAAMQADDPAIAQQILNNTGGGGAQQAAAHDAYDSGLVNLIIGAGAATGGIVDAAQGAGALADAAGGFGQSASVPGLGTSVPTVGGSAVAESPTALSLGVPTVAGTDVAATPTIAGLGLPATDLSTVGTTGALSAAPDVTGIGTDTLTGLADSGPTSDANMGTGLSDSAGGGSSALDKLGQLAQLGGKAIGGATSAAASNRGNENTFDLGAAQLGISGYNANTTAQNDYQTQLMNRAKLEMEQRNTDRQNMYRASVADNPHANPYNPAGTAALNPDYVAALNALSSQGGADLSKGPTYDASKMPAPAYTPFDYAGNVPKWKQPSPLESAGNWLGPALSLAGAAAGYF
jgi:hypothetical protein